MNPSIPEVQTAVASGVGFVTLNRPRALNALSLSMIRALWHTLIAWRDDPAILAVAIRGASRAAPSGAEDALLGDFCAGGDIRFFYQAALAGDAALDDFFTEEYRLDYLIHTYPKPYIAFMDGVVMGGGMGISQGARLRIVTERTKMAMPETGIGLFPDVGGGYFLSRCPDHVGVYLALTGETIGGAQALACGLADVCLPALELPHLWAALQIQGVAAMGLYWSAIEKIAYPAHSMGVAGHFDAKVLEAFSLDSVAAIVAALQAQDSQPARATLATLRRRSPLMLHVVLEQLRRARHMALADVLRMERDMVWHCFYPRHLGRSAAASEVVEGIRALAIDKDGQPRWNPVHLEEVTAAMVAPFFTSPWDAAQHPLAV